VKVVAAVDLEPAALQNAQRYLRLPPERCYTDPERAFAENPADFCTVVIPPAAHEAVVDLALRHELDILSEKPIADTLEASVRIAQKVRQAGRKMGVTMSNRFAQDKATLRHELRSGHYGRVDYLVLRLTYNCRTYGSWGAFRHEISNPLLIEAGVHHLDVLAELAGAPIAASRRNLFAAGFALVALVIAAAGSLTSSSLGPSEMRLDRVPDEVNSVSSAPLAWLTRIRSGDIK